MMRGKISLVKGARADLTRDNPELQQVFVGLGWDARSSPGVDFDLDASAFLVGADGGVREFVYYYTKSNSNGSVVLDKDDRTGASSTCGDDERIYVKLSEIPRDIQKIVFAINIYEARQRGQTFGQVDNAFVRVVDQSLGRELLRYELGRDGNFSDKNTVVMGELYRYNGGWKFAAIGRAFNLGGIGELPRVYDMVPMNRVV